jgi:signal transduction histidine kinase
MNETPRILIVDDEPSARQTMEMLLLKEGYEMVLAEDGPEALMELDEEAVDVILLDVMMPGMDGFELCRRLKANPRWRPIPVILVTALDSKQDLALGLDAGADDFVHKPVNGLELRARVRSMLRIKKRHDDLQAALRMREDLSNMIVHDIRSPLSTILIYCDLLQDKVVEPESAEEVETIRNEANRLSSFLNDMLMMAKMEHGRLLLSRSPVDVNGMVQAVRESYRPMAGLKSLDLAVDLPPETRRLSLDANLWRRVLDNLTSNAVKFSPSGGAITLQVRYPNDDTAGDSGTAQLRLRVVDEGPGIAAEHHESVFDKFKVVTSRRQDVKQVGLGLAFCKMVVEAHGGRIFVENNRPRGSIFTVEV